MSDFLRQLPRTGHSLHTAPSLWQRLHLDPWLVLLLLILAGAGMVVLYSASGESLGAVIRQGRFFLIAFAVMFFVAQLDPERIKRKVEEICSSYESPDEMAAAYFGNPQVMARLEPVVLEEQAVDWLVEHGIASTREVGFKEYVKP